jgi:hypothetical protein
MATHLGDDHDHAKGYGKVKGKGYDFSALIRTSSHLSCLK